MKNQFELTKKGTVKVTVWANPTTQEIYPANRNSFGYNANYDITTEFYAKYGKNLKTSQGKADARKFYYSSNEMRKAGFQLVYRGSYPLWGGIERPEPVAKVQVKIEVPVSVKDWADFGANHPAPQVVLDAKKASGLSWADFVQAI